MRDAASVSSSTEVPWARLGVAVGAPVVVFLVGMAVTIGFNSESAFPNGSQAALYVGAALFVLVPGIASLAPRIVGNERLGRWATVAITIIVATVLAWRMIEDLVGVALNAPNLFVVFWVDVFVASGIYVGARIGARAVGGVWVNFVAAGAVFFGFAVIALAPVLGLM
jgi:hypothetical protein